MPVSATGSEPTLLSALWYGSLILAALAFVVMAGLIIKRVLFVRKLRHADHHTQHWTRCFHAAINAPVAPTKTSLPPLTAVDVPVVMNIALTLLRNVRGQDANRIIAMFEAWDLITLLRTNLRTGSKSERLRTLTLFAHCTDEASLSHLLEQVSATDMYVQLTALRGLAMRGATQHLDHILASLGRSGRTNMLMLADVLQRFGAPVVPSLCALVQSEAVLEVRLAGIHALGTLGVLEAVDTLVALLDDPHSDICAAAITALSKLGDSRAGEAILPHLTSPEQAVRVQAAQALGGFHLPAAIAPLVARLDDSDWWVRFRAAEALHRYGDQGIALLQAIASREGNRGVIAQQVLAERGGLV
jgi:hypothetical protein